MDIKLLDTGYVSATVALGSQTQLTDANRAGYTGSAVSAFTLNVLSIGQNLDVNTENRPVVNTATDVKTSFVSTNNETYSLSCAFKKSSLTSSGYSTNNAYQLKRMSRTEGLKLLYPSSTATTKKTIIEAFGAINTGGIFSAASPSEDNGTVATTVPYLVGRVKNMRWSDDPSGDYWRINFDFEVSG